MIKPLFGNVLIEIHKMNDDYVKMIDEENAKIEKATVLAVGPDAVKRVKKGDIIIFKKYNLDTIELDGKSYSFIPLEDCKAIWKQ